MHPFCPPFPRVVNMFFLAGRMSHALTAKTEKRDGIGNLVKTPEFPQQIIIIASTELVSRTTPLNKYYCSRRVEHCLHSPDRVF